MMARMHTHLIEKAECVVATCITKSHYQTACRWLELAYLSPRASYSECQEINHLWGQAQYGLCKQSTAEWRDGYD